VLFHRLLLTTSSLVDEHPEIFVKLCRVRGNVKAQFAAFWMRTPPACRASLEGARMRLALTVSLIVLGVVLLVGLIGYWINKLNRF